MLSLLKQGKRIVFLKLRKKKGIESVWIAVCLICLGMVFPFSAYPHGNLMFIENKGQWESNVRYRADLGGGILFIENNRLSYLFYDAEKIHEIEHQKLDFAKVKAHSLRVSFFESNENPSIIGLEQLPYYYNYFLGNDRSKWASGVNLFRSVLIKNIYPGTDIELTSTDNLFKYNIILHPGADPKQIKLKYEGSDKISMENNILKIMTSMGVVTEQMPEVYVLIGNEKHAVGCEYMLKENVLSFSIPDGSDRNYRTVIDPVVIFSSYSGSLADNFGYTATYDDSGYAYSGGTVFSMGFPVTTGAFQLTFAGGHSGNVFGSGMGRDIGILKYRPDGRSLVYATYLGGSGNEDPHSMVVDKNFNLIIFGNTSSKNFPIGNKFYDSSFNGSYDIFLAKFSLDGKSLLASTYLGGSGEDGLNGYYIQPPSGPNQSELGFNYGDSYRGEVNIDSKNRILVMTTTKSSDFPVTSGCFQSTYGGGLQDAVVCRFSNDLDTLQKASFIGGLQDDAGYGLAVNSKDEIYVCGGTRSTDLKTTTGKYQPSYQGGVADGFIYYISEDFQQAKSATYFGTNAYDQVYFVQLDANDFVYVTGQTKSDNFPVKNVKYSKSKGKIFISKLNPGLDSLIYSTVIGLGGTNPELSPSAFLVDICERVYFSGWGGGANNSMSRNTNSYTTGLPVTSDAFQKSTDGSDFYVCVFSKDIQSLLYATFFGGNLSEDHVDGGTSRFDKKGVVYQSVCASCGGYDHDFPTYPGNVHSTTNNSPNCNNAIFKIDLDIPDLLADFSIDTIFCLADSTHIINKTVGGDEYFWDFGIPWRTDDTMSAFEPRFHYPDTGTYKVTLIARNINTCDQADTTFRYVRVYNQSEADFIWQPEVCRNEISFEAKSKYSNDFRWNFGDPKSAVNHSNLPKPIHVYSDTGTYQATLIVDSGTVCEYRISKTIYIDQLPIAGFSFTVDTCNGNALFLNKSQQASSYFWDYGDGDTSKNDNLMHKHKYQTADSFHVTLIAMPNTVCADTVYSDIVLKINPANALILLDTCRLTASFYGISPYSTNSGWWDFGDGNDTAMIDTVLNYQFAKPGLYQITFLANNGTLCIDTVIRTLEIPPLPIAMFSDSVFLCSSDVRFINQSQHAVKFYWDFGNGQTGSSKDTFFITYKDPGKYTIRLAAVSSSQCRDTMTDTIDIEHLAKADFQPFWDTCTNRVKIYNKSSKGGACNWFFGDGTSEINSSSIFYHHYDTSGIFRDTVREYQILLVVTDGPCTDSLIQKVLIYSSPSADFSVKYDSCEPTALFEAQSHGAVNVFWDLGDTTIKDKSRFLYKYAGKGEYWVKFVMNRDTFCADSVSKKIKVGEYEPEKIEIPNVFTPNNDGINEIYTIKGMNFLCDNYEFYVFNRWGQLVFKAVNEPIWWDGKYNGIPLSPSTYYYIFKSRYFETSGTITLIR